MVIYKHVSGEYRMCSCESSVPGAVNRQWEINRCNREVV